MAIANIQNDLARRATMLVAFIPLVVVGAAWVATVAVFELVADSICDFPRVWREPS